MTLQRVDPHELGQRHALDVLNGKHQRLLMIEDAVRAHDGRMIEPAASGSVATEVLDETCVIGRQVLHDLEHDVAQRVQAGLFAREINLHGFARVKMLDQTIRTDTLQNGMFHATTPDGDRRPRRPP